MHQTHCDDGTEPCAIRIRHPRECGPRRPERHPAWVPGRRDRRDAGPSRLQERVERIQTRLVTATTLGAVRINFRYAAFQSMAAAHSEKAGRDQFFEGPHETFGFRLDEIHPSRLDLQYQPADLEWLTPAGVNHRMTFDWAVEMQDHRIVFGEDKASAAYFDDPDLAERLDFAAAFLEAKGASLDRRIAGSLPTALQRRVVKDIYDARRTEFDGALAVRVQDGIRSAGGTARLGDVLDIVGRHPALSLDIVRAMMHRRVLTMPISAPPMPDTPVTIPPKARKHALRAFLAAHVPVSR